MSDARLPLAEFRELFFGDFPAARVATLATDGPPATLGAAMARARSGDRAGGAAALLAVARREDLEARWRLQAWTALRELGEPIDDAEGKEVLGVVVDVPLEGGVDTLAAYVDGSARYINHAGGAIVWDRPDDRFDGEVGALLAAADDIVAEIGPWDGPRPPLAAGLTRISLLTPSGLHFGEAPFDTLAEDGLAGPLIAAAAKLMGGLIESSDGGEPDEAHEDDAEPPGPAVEKLRLQVLNASHEELKLSPIGSIWGVLMELGFDHGWATVVALTDGSASLYLSSGGGVIGGGQHERAAQAAKALCRQAASLQSPGGRVDEFPTPGPDRVRFYLLAVDGVRTFECAESELAEGSHPFSALYARGQDVITALRELSSARGG